MTTLVHFEITATNVETTADFYATVLGLGAEPSPFVPNYILLNRGNDTLGAVMDKTYREQSVIVWFGVDNIEATLVAIKSAGGKQAGEINVIPGEGQVVYATDPNGTTFGLRQAERA